MGTGLEHSRVHYLVRKYLHHVCTKCGSTLSLQAALRPNIDPARLKVDSVSGCKYSVDPGDYITLCFRCHRKQDLVEARPRCINGHEYTPENTRMQAGARICRICHRIREAIRLSRPECRAKKREFDQRYRSMHPLTIKQKKRKIELQRRRRTRARRSAVAAWEVFARWQP
jgi:hypothetical protein